MKDLQQYLLDAGYNKHTNKYYECFKATDTLFQKCIRDVHNNKLYYIDCWWYEPQYGIPESIQFEVQFTLKDGENLNVQSFYKDIETNEQFFYNMWEKMGFDYYEKYEDR